MILIAGVAVFSLFLVAWMMRGFVSPSVPAPQESRPPAAAPPPAPVTVQPAARVASMDEEMTAFFAALPRPGGDPAPLASFEGKWKGSVASVDLDEGVGARPSSLPALGFSIERRGGATRFIPDPGFGAERALQAAGGEVLAVAPNLPDLHLRLDGQTLTGWLETPGPPRGRMEFHATRAP